MHRDDAISWLWRKRMWVELRHTVRRDGPKRFLLAKLLGKTSVEHLYQSLTEEDQQTCLALIGPNAYTVYRTLLVKRGLEDKDYVPAEWYNKQDSDLNDIFRADKAPL